MDPSADDSIEIHNERFTLLKPNYAAIGDYTCRALNEDKTVNEKEFATVKVRSQPYIEDFGVETSHTGKSSVITDGERLELICRVRDQTVPVNITWLRSDKPDDERLMVPINEVEPGQLIANNHQQQADPFVQTYTSPNNVVVERLNNFTKRLVIESVGPEHRSYYSCLVDNGVTERARKTIFIRVKDKIVALWPFLGIMAELFILFTIIYVWETQRAYKAMQASGNSGSSSATTPTAKRPASGLTNAFETVPLNT